MGIFHLTTRDVIRWLRPWPIRLPPKATWEFSLASFSEAERLKIFWKVQGKHRTAQWWAMKCLKQAAPQEQHYCYSIAVERMPVARSLTVIVMPWEGVEVVVDGNHHLVAALLARRWGAGRCALRGVGLIRMQT